jgi:hypothetical protein
MINAVGRLYPGCVAGLPYVDELVRRLRLDGRPLDVAYGPQRTVTLTRPHPHEEHLVELVVSEPDLQAAATALGAECRDALWPDESTETAGFNLLLVHLDEVVATRDTTGPLRIAADGVQWPGRHRHHRGHRR